MRKELNVIDSKLLQFAGDPSILPTIDKADRYEDVEQAAFSRPLRLTTAKDYIDIIVDRATQTSDQDFFLTHGFMVSRIFLFGSVLREKDRPNNVDLAISGFFLYENFSQRLAELEAGEKWVSSCYKWLKSGTRQVNLTCPIDIAVLGCPHRLIYANPLYGCGERFVTPVFKDKR